MLSLALPNLLPLCLSFSSIPQYVLPVSISLKYLADLKFDYHLSQ